MFLKKLYLRNFRLYEEAFFEFDPQVNMICGANAQGKTTVLEAIYYLITGRSFRALRPQELIRQGAEFFYLEAIFEKHGIEQRLRISSNATEKKIFYNQTEYPTAAGLLGLIQGVLMAPDDAMLVKGSPQLRRQFLDLQLAQTDPLYIHHLTRYHRALKQRNTLLRLKNELTIESWEHEMATAAAYVVLQRQKTIADLQKSIYILHPLLAGSQEKLEIVYKSNLPPTENLTVLRDHQLALYQKQRKREMYLGTTLTGPQKDDLSFLINEKDARYFGSEGQQRTTIASIRFAEWERLRNQSSQTPLMLLDDIGISLDESRRQKLYQRLQMQGQVFLTATDPLPISSAKNHFLGSTSFNPLFYQN